MVRKFVLRCDWFAKKLKELSNNDRYTSLRSPALQNEVQLFKGTLAEEIIGKTSDVNPPYTGMVNVKSLDHDDLYVTCPECVLVAVDNFQAECLLAVVPNKDRWSIIEDKQWLKEARLLTGDVNVSVRIKEDKEPAHGIIRYVGPVPEISRGCMFGIELLEHFDWGFTDGSLNGHVYFRAWNRNAVFVSLNRVRLLPDKKKINGSALCQVLDIKSGVSTSENGSLGPLVPIQCSQHTSPQPPCRPLPISFDQALAEGAPRPPLQLKDRVVWISDKGPEYGVVKWLGKLPDVGNDWMVGVEFDNPVGSGTGKYLEQQLFEAQQNHASLVPIIGLMKAEDFLGDKTPCEFSFLETY